MLTAKDLVGLLDGLEAAGGSDAVWRQMQDFFTGHGLPWLCYGYTARDKSAVLKVPDLRTNVPKDYVDRWLEDQICSNDPGLQHSISSRDIAVFGSEFLRRGQCDDAVYEFYRDVRAIGSCSVVTVPLRSLRRKAAGFFEIGGPLSRSEMNRFLGESRRLISLAVHFADERMLALADVEAVEDAGLTEREKTCLQWLAKGQRYEQIAYRLSISVATVRFHIMNARRKLKAQTPEQAVARAVSIRLIEP